MAIVRIGPVRRAGATIVEVLVTTAIIAVLIGILVPAVQVARRSAARIQCINHLHQIGLGCYLHAEQANGRLPIAVGLPTSASAADNLAVVLGPVVEQSQLIFRCPLDLAYQPTLGLSYEYSVLAPPPLNPSGKTLDELAANPIGLGLGRITLAYDFEQVHAPSGTSHSRNFLYADGHVD